MVKRARVLEDDVDADVPYEDTRLARRAPAARRRLAVLLGLGALVLAVNAAASHWAWLLGTAALGLLAWGVARGRLGAIVGAAFCAVVGVGLALQLLFTTGFELARTAFLVVVLVLGVASGPDLVLLLRDAELQNAYGLWARRGS